MSPKTQPLIYAELLANIRQISVIVALDAPCGSSTTAELSVDGRQFILHHDGDTFTMNLPGQAALVHLQRPVLGNKELSWRIPIAGQVTRASIEAAQSNEAPWSARELSDDAEFGCRNCGAIVLKKGTIKIWKDLPSENWAEMMEFWHCHKPDVPVEEANSSIGSAGHVHHGQTATVKGYGPSSRFIASKAVGFVDITTFLIASDDCTSIEIVQSSTPSSAICKACQRPIGRNDPQSDGVRLFKWSLVLHSSNPLVLQRPTVTSFVSSQCLSALQTSSVSMLVLKPTPLLRCSLGTSMSSSSSSSATSSWATSCGPQSGVASQSGSTELHASSGILHIWVLNSALTICARSSTLTPYSGLSLSPPKLAMKVFWRSISTDDASSLLDGGSAEELTLPDEIVGEVGTILRNSACCLPPSARKFKEWDVGLLERYQPKL